MSSFGDTNRSSMIENNFISNTNNSIDFEGVKSPMSLNGFVSGYASLNTKQDFDKIRNPEIINL